MDTLLQRFLPTLLDARAHASDGFQWQTQVETWSFCLDVLQAKKLSVLLIKNGDKLCCARAIVTAKARVDQHPNCDRFKRGRRIQAEHAVDLHHKTRVPRGPCGYDELLAFSLASSLYDYQILLCDATRGYVVTSFGPPSQKHSSSSTMMAITTSSLLYLDSLAPPTSA